MSGNEDDYLNDLTESLLEDYNARKEEETIDDVSVQSLSSRALYLNTVGVDMKANSPIHMTNKFELTRGHLPFLVFRRGRQFSLGITFNRPYDPRNDTVYLRIEYGPPSRSSYKNGTKFRIPVSSNSMSNQWDVVITETNGAAVKLEVNIPANALVGLWRLSIEVFNKPLNSSKVYDNQKIQFFVLFNPWCKDDEVYLEDEASREEYVMNDHGYIFSGTGNQPSFYSWVFGQFDYSVLPAIILLLERTNLPHHKRGSAVLISRALSSIINNMNDGNGLLVGNWTGEYRNGTAPEAWTGSTAIYRQYLESSGNPVKYAECWVFSGCTTTAFRALGIPCRSITCFNSAHETDNTLTIDNYFDIHGKPTGKSIGPWGESIWNFHCWNEMWTARHDLPSGYDGWQIVDSTPQEQSAGMYRLGPCPVKALKEGDLGVNYDASFTFSEVNADICNFVENKKSPWGFSLIDMITNSIGNLIVTQSMQKGNESKVYMENITSLYKYTEGSSKEREVYLKAVKQIPTAQKFYNQIYGSEDKDVTFKLENFKSVSLGDSFDVTLAIENLSEETRNIDIDLSANAVLYTRTQVDKVKEGHVQIEVKPKDKKLTKLQVTKEDYINKILKTNHIKIEANSKVKETGQISIVEDFFEILKQQLIIEGPVEAQLGSKVSIVISFKNPLEEELSNCFLAVEGAGLQRPTTFIIPNVASVGAMTKAITVVPRQVGKCTLVGIFSSQQLTHISGSFTILIHQ